MPKIGYNIARNINTARVGTNPTLTYWEGGIKERPLIPRGGKKLASIEERVEKLLQPTIEKIGYDLYDVEYAKEGKNYFLRVFIDKPEGIDLEDCEKVSNEINGLLDEADYIKEQYFLEVSSPGIERILKKDRHLEQNKGKEIQVKLFQKDEKGKKEYQGELKEFTEEGITIILEEAEERKIERKNIAQIKTIYHW